MPVQRPENVYHFFLKIAADGSIPDHYELLGVPRFSEDPAVIKQAAVARSSELRGWDNSDYHVWSNELLDEVVVALMVLESPTDKAEYDRDLRQTLDRASTPLPEAASPKPNRVVNGIRELRRVLAGIPKPVPPTPPAAAVNIPVGDASATAGTAKPNTKPDNTAEVHFDSADGEDQSSHTAAPTPPPFGSLDPFWRYAPLRNGLLAALVVVPLIGWWWLTPRTGWLVLSGGVDDLELFVDGKRLALQGGGPALPLTAGRHTLETKRDDEIVETRELTIPSGGPPLVIELKKPTPPIAKAPFTAEQAKKIQSASAKRLRVQTSFENQVGMSFTLIPAGTFRMGSDERGYSDESPQHEVQISKPFYLGTHEVRQSDYEAVMGVFAPTRYHELDNPRTNVTWADATRFCEKLSGREQRRYRLPTEAEWEYACRAGTETMWNFGPENEPFAEHGWIEKNSNKATHPVGKLQPNAWGLFDMHGNVSEWCEDRYENKYYSVSPPIDPTGPATGSALSTRICRGGSCLSLATEARSAFRGSNSSSVASNSTGFRIVLEVDSVAKNELAAASSTTPTPSSTTESSPNVATASNTAIDSASPPAASPTVATQSPDPFQQGTVWTKRTNGAVSSEFTILKRTGNELEVRYKGSANVIVAKATVTAMTIQWSHKDVSKVEQGKAFRGEVTLVGDATHCKLDWEVSSQSKGVADLTLEPKTVASGPGTVASGAVAAGGLDRPITVNFNRTPLQDAVAEVGTKGNFEIDLDGDALKGGGYTKNMTQTFAVTNKPAREVLEQIVQQYSRMVVIQLNGNYRLTTREDADAKKQVIVVPTAATKTTVSTSPAPAPALAVNRAAPSLKPGARTATLPAGYCMDVAVLPDATRCVSVDLEGKVTLWDLSSGKSLGTLGSHGGRADKLLLIANGRIACSGAFGDGSTAFYDVDGRDKPFAKLSGPSGLVRLAVTADGQRLLVNCATSVRIYLITLASTKSPLSKPQQQRIAGKKLVFQADTSHGRFQLHDDGVLPSFGSIACHPVNADWVYLAPTNGSKTLTRMDLSQRKAAASFEGMETWSPTIRVSGDGRRFMAHSDKRKHLVWDAVTGNVVTQFDGPSYPAAMDISQDGRHALIHASDAHVEEWSLDPPAKLWELRPWRSRIHHVYYFDNSRKIIVAFGGGVDIWNAPAR